MPSSAIQSSARKSKQKRFFATERCVALWYLGAYILKQHLQGVRATSSKSHVAISILYCITITQKHHKHVLDWTAEKKETANVPSPFFEKLRVLRSLLLFFLIWLCTTSQHAWQFYLKQLIVEWGKKLNIPWKRLSISTC